MRYLFSLVALVVFYLPCYSQDLINRVKALEDLNAAQGKRLDAVEASVSRLEAAVFHRPFPTVTATTPAVPGKPGPCQCGCDVTGKCLCPSCSVGCGFLPAPAKSASKEACDCAGPRPAVRYWTTAGSGVIQGSDGSVHTLGVGAFANGYDVVGRSSSCSSGAGASGSCGSSGCAGGSCGNQGGFFRRR